MEEKKENREKVLQQTTLEDCGVEIGSNLWRPLRQAGGEGRARK